MGCNGNSWNYSHPHPHTQRLILLTLEIFVLCEETAIEASLMMLNGAYCSIGMKELEEYDFEKREKKLYRVNQT